MKINKEDVANYKIDFFVHKAQRTCGPVPVNGLIWALTEAEDYGEISLAGPEVLEYLIENPEKMPISLLANHDMVNFGFFGQILRDENKREYVAALLSELKDDGDWHLVPGRKYLERDGGFSYVYAVVLEKK